MSRNATQPRTAASGKANQSSTSLSHETIADHIAAFRKRGGRIEVLGNTPLRASVAPTSRTRKTPQAQAPATGKAAG